MWIPFTFYHIIKALITYLSYITAQTTARVWYGLMLIYVSQWQPAQNVRYTSHSEDTAQSEKDWLLTAYAPSVWNPPPPLSVSQYTFTILYLSVLEFCRNVYADFQPDLPDASPGPLERLPTVPGSPSAGVPPGLVGSHKRVAGMVTTQQTTAQCWYNTLPTNFALGQCCTTIGAAFFVCRVDLVRFECGLL